MFETPPELLNEVCQLLNLLMTDWLSISLPYLLNSFHAYLLIYLFFFSFIVPSEKSYIAYLSRTTNFFVPADSPYIQPYFNLSSRVTHA